MNGQLSNLDSWVIQTSVKSYLGNTCEVQTNPTSPKRSSESLTRSDKSPKRAGLERKPSEKDPNRSEQVQTKQGQMDEFGQMCEKA